MATQEDLDKYFEAVSKLVNQAGEVNYFFEFYFSSKRKMNASDLFHQFS